ncbi:MAG: signal peptidase I [Natrialbaceae archaeon]|nr:signal peptidase I [Natrialbaceae archaeon]
MVHRSVSVAIQLILLGTVGALVLGHVLGQPVLLGYVTTGSMEPTIETGDGFVAIPSAIADEPAVGDVVVYSTPNSETLTTHRIVGETDSGYITKGDANPFTDQDGGAPPIRRGQIEAVALQVGGSVLTIPALGTAVETVTRTIDGWLEQAGGQVAPTTLALGVFAVSIALYAVETLREHTVRGAESGAIDRHRLSVGVAVLVVAVALVAMMFPAGAHSYDVISADFESDRPLVIERGSTVDHELSVSNGGFVPVVSYVEPRSDSISVESESISVGPRSEGTMPLRYLPPRQPATIHSMSRSTATSTSFPAE